MNRKIKIKSIESLKNTEDVMIYSTQCHYKDYYSPDFAWVSVEDFGKTFNATLYREYVS